MASTLITLAELRQYLSTELSDAALERLVDAIDAEIIRVYGPHDGERTEQVPGLSHRVWLSRPAASVAAVSEYGSHQAPSEAITVPTDRYQLENGGRTLWRTGSAFLAKVLVTYTPVAENPRRTQALIELVKLETASNTGLVSQTVGQYSETYQLGATGDDRSRILAGLRQPYAGAGLLV